MTDPPYWFDIGTASAWLVLSLLGIALRLRRLVHLRRIVLVTPSVRADVEYLALVKRSTVLRLIVKAVFLVGALIALFGLTWLWPFWRVGIVVALLCMLTETASVDRVRSRLGRTVGPD